MNNKYEYYERKEEHIEAKEQRISINRRRKKKNLFCLFVLNIYIERKKKTPHKIKNRRRSSL
jgi:hypothetical protein